MRLAIVEKRRFYVKVHPGFVKARAKRGDPEAVRVRECLNQIPNGRSVTIKVGTDPSRIHPDMPGPEDVGKVVVCGAYRYGDADGPRCVNTQALALRLGDYDDVRISQKASLVGKG